MWYSLCYMLIKFAENIGIDFYTPEEFFFKQKPAPFEWPTFVPVCVLHRGLDGIITGGGYIQGKYKGCEKPFASELQEVAHIL